MAAAGRRSRCFVVMPESMAPEHTELVRGYREGVVAWSGDGGGVPHFTAGTDQREGQVAGDRRPRLHILGDDPIRSVYGPGANGRACLLEDFWPATFDLYRARPGAGTQVDELAVPPRASRAVWAGLDVGVEVAPHDVVVAILSDTAEPAALGLGGVLGRFPLGRRVRTALRGALAAVVAVAVLLLGVFTAVAVTPSLLGINEHRSPRVVAGRGPQGSGTGSAHRPTLTGFPAYAARVRGPSISVYKDPDPSSASLGSFPGIGDYEAPQTFLVEQEQRAGDDVWYQVLLPVRPNGTKGWVRAADVEVVGLPYRIKVHLGSLRLELFHDGELERTFPIGIGTADTPTPPGTYAIKYLMRPDDQNTLYGHFVYGLSGFSDVIRDVPGGGELGIHGTNDPEHSIGRRVSHGCIRLRNEDVESLVPFLPLGTPVDVDDAGVPLGVAFGQDAVIRAHVAPADELPKGRGAAPVRARRR